MSPIVLPNGYQYVIGALAFIPWLLGYQTFLVSKARKRAKIAYPQVYAELSEIKENPEAQKFNCAQRAHQNTLEAIPVLFVSTLIAGLTFPVVAGAMCGMWSLGRILYARGYGTGNPSKRRFGFHLSTTFLYGLILASSYNAVNFIAAGL